MTVLARLSTAAAGLLIVLAAGCGGDDEGAATSTSTSTSSEPPPTQTAPATPTQTSPPSTSTAPDEPEPPPEEQPGGAGDEEPARSVALFTGVRGQVRPRAVRVPPFIAIRIELRSADGGAYGLACGSRLVQVDGEITSASTRMAGRRPGQQVRCGPLGDHNGVTVTASAEPGP